MGSFQNDSIHINVYSTKFQTLICSETGCSAPLVFHNKLLGYILLETCEYFVIASWFKAMMQGTRA
jgi:hypothetical protein